MTSAKASLRSFFDAALLAALPAGKFGTLPKPPESGRTLVLGAGKAAASMAAAFEDQWQASYPNHAISGLVITRYDHDCPTRWIKVRQASHPVPDVAGVEATQALKALADQAGPDDLVIMLLSGGASSLLVQPVEGLSLDDKQKISRALLKAGAPIDAMNLVRQSLSQIKGGRLAALVAPARLVTYAISDVPGDVPAVIGSGPTVPPLGSSMAAIQTCQRYGITVPAHVLAAMRAPAMGAPVMGAPAMRPPAMGDPVMGDGEAPVLDQTDFRLIATPQMALEAAAAACRDQGYSPMILSDRIEGEAKDVAQVMAGIAHQVSNYDQPARKPCVLLSGGETSVTVKGTGRGGRNAEFLLALAIALQGKPGISAIACDTDGIDGIETNAGAVIDETTLSRAQAMGLKATAYLDNNDAFSFFEALGDLVVTGPTLTNVNDFRAILIAA